MTGCHQFQHHPSPFQGPDSEPNRPVSADSNTSLQSNEALHDLSSSIAVWVAGAQDAILKPMRVLGHIIQGSETRGVRTGGHGGLHGDEARLAAHQANEADAI